jgi:hypothetical protein
MLSSFIRLQRLFPPVVALVMLALRVALLQVFGPVVQARPVVAVPLVQARPVVAAPPVQARPVVAVPPV